MSRRFTALLITLLFCRPTAAEGPLAGTEYVPASELRGRHLVLEDMNASIEAPGEGWIWLQESGVRSKEVRRYLCRAPDESRSYLFGVLDRNLDPATEKGAREWVSGMLNAEKFRIMGFKLLECTQDHIPLDPGSFRYQAHAEATEEVPAIEMKGFVSFRGRVYSFQYLGTAEAMAARDLEFERFVRSFQMLRPVDPPPHPPSPWGLITLVTILTLTGVAGLGAWIGLKGLRPQASRVAGTYGCVILCAAFILPALVGLLMYPKANHSELGEVTGRLFASVLLVGLIPAGIIAIALRTWGKKPGVMSATDPPSDRPAREDHPPSV